MSFVIASPEALLAAATDLAAIRSTIRAANAAAAVPTTGALAPAADEVSAGIAALFGAQAQSYQAVSAQAAAFHDRFVQLLNAGGGSYASAEIANAQQNLLNAVNAPTQTLLGRPLVGDGADGASGPVGQPGGDGGILWGNGGNGGDSTSPGLPGSRRVSGADRQRRQGRQRCARRCRRQWRPGRIAAGQRGAGESAVPVTTVWETSVLAAGEAMAVWVDGRG